MIVLVGFVIVIGAVLGGFTMAGGHVHSLVHPSEVVTIGGAALGALVVMSPKRVLIDLVKGILMTIKGTPFNLQMYEDTFKLLYDLFRAARRDGLLILESHLLSPANSTIFQRYPRVYNNHHVTHFICDAILPAIEGTSKPEQIAELLDIEIRTAEEEHHGPLNVLQRTADALPGFGIVAAVLGIVITMGAIDGPVEEVGHKVGAALVGTFLGILLSYGFFAPLAGRMEFLGAAETAYLRTVAATITAFLSDAPPKVALERGRRGVASEYRPSRERLDEIFAEVEQTAA